MSFHARVKNFGGLIFTGPPCDLHSICDNFCDSEVQRTRDFIILNWGPIRPPRNEEANASHARHRVQNFSPISVPSPCVFDRLNKKKHI